MKLKTATDTAVPVDFEQRDSLYRIYVSAVEDYVKEPTVVNWEKKEKAFENYNALIESFRNVS